MRLSVVWIVLSAAMVSIAVDAADSQPENGFRSRELKVPGGGKTYLQRLAPSVTGVNFTNFISEEKGLENSLLTSGAGVAAGDVDGDGWCDLYFCGTENPNALYRNLGDWKFTDVTASAGLAVRAEFSSGAVFADVDGDNDLDLLVSSLGGGVRLFLNDGKGKFVEKTDAGLVRKYGSTSMALADIDGNGTLDLYVCNYAKTKIEDRPNTKFDAKTINGKMVITAIDGMPMTSPELTNRYFVDAERIVRERGEPDILYLNLGNGTFKALSWTDGTFLDDDGKPLALPELDFGLSVMFRDMDGDLDPDIYICNDLFPPDRIWVNVAGEKPGTYFRAMSNFAVRNTSLFSMGVDFADINHDGYDDFFVVDMLSRDHVNRKVQMFGVSPVLAPVGRIDDRPQSKRNTLFLARPDGTYAEIAQLSGLDATEWSWMPLFLDVDMDGFEDVLVTTGHMRDSLNADAVGEILKRRTGRKLTDAEHRALKKEFYPLLRTSTQAFRNKGDLTFEDKAREWGFDYVGITQGMCLADLDNDGDADVVVVPLNDAITIYRNETSAPRVAVRLKGKAPNTRGIGAKIRFYGGAAPRQQQEMMAGGRYLSCDDTVRSFPCGKSTNGMRIEVAWRNGTVSVVDNVKANHVYEIDEALAVKGTNLPAVKHQALFADVSELINHKHVDEGFNDFEQQPLLGRRLSQPGPGVTWHDVDGDGWEDLLIGSGGGGRLAFYRNDGKGGFQSKPLDKPVARDQTSILPWPKASSNAPSLLLVGSSNYEDGGPTGGCAVAIDPFRQTVEDNLPPWECSTGPLAMADWDGDGVLDLFVGGRTLPGKYPEEPFSLLFRGTDKGFALDDSATRQLTSAGMVSGAVFSDLDGDGHPELVLACDWGPIRIFRRTASQMQLWNPPVQSANGSALTLGDLKGWWNGVTTGDFDNDGRFDIVASNWGRNSKYEHYRSQPVRIYYADWRGDGTFDSFEAFYDPVTARWLPWATVAAARRLPWVAERFPTYETFGKASISEVLGERMKSAQVREANWLDTTVFLNRGDRFEVRSLPIETQFAPGFGVNVADFNADGNDDIFLSQNFFATDSYTTRYDAGRGLLLAGDGRGNFRGVPGEESGIKVYGEQRGSAVCDYDADGRVDLVVSQNGAETKLYRNVTAKLGLRVRLEGPPANPQAIGATLRLLGPESTPLPAREVHGGSGYLSHDSAVTVLSVPTVGGNAPPPRLSIRWPGGKTSTVNFPMAAQEIAVSASGELRVLR
jgi:enediyne biosynthesis protein E4